MNPGLALLDSKNPNLSGESNLLLKAFTPAKGLLKFEKPPDATEKFKTSLDDCVDCVDCPKVESCEITELALGVLFKDFTKEIGTDSWWIWQNLWIGETKGECCNEL